MLRAALAGRYDVRRELARGGMAAVYLATDLKHHREVALKVLVADVSAAIGADRFLREIEIIGALRHPHILPLYDSGEADQFLFYVMPFVGESLRDRLKRERQLPLDEALLVAREVADALAYAHSRRVVHRDIKPENILFDSGHAVVADFGIAKALSAAGEEQLTVTGLSVGTPAYMSPEQAVASAVDGRSDVYALGCVLYEMLAGHPPFTGPTESVVRQHLTVQPVAITAIRPSVPADVASAIERALAKSPEDRFATVRELADALRSPAAAAAGSAGRRAAWPRKPLIYASIAALAVIGVGAWSMRRAANRHDRPVIRSVAVLPLANLSSDSAQGFFVDGVHDALIGELSRISGLDVSGRASVMSYRASPRPASVVARELDVDAVIEGSVFRSGDSVRIEVRLISANPARQLWSNAYQRDTRNVVGMMGDVARTIAQEVRVTLTPQEAAGLSAPRSADPVAQDHLLRGKELLYRRDSSGILGSITELNQAVLRDNSYSAAYAALASARSLANVLYLVPADSSYTGIARGLAAADRAILLDSSNAEAYAARGYIEMSNGAPVELAERDLRRAIALKPSYAEAYGWLAQLITADGRVREALENADRALALDPVSTAMRMAKATAAFLGDSLTLAVELARPIRMVRPDIWPPWVQEGLSLAVLGRAAECVDIDGMPPTVRALCLHTAGRRAEAEAQIQPALAQLRNGRMNADTFILGYYYAWSGQLEAGIGMLEREFTLSPAMIMSSESHRLWAPVRDAGGGRFLRTLRQLRANAWRRVVAESRTVALP